MHPIIENNKAQIIELCKTHHVQKLYAFGSVVRDDFNETSDVDFLYEFDTALINFNDLKNAPYDFADNFFQLSDKLEKLLNRSVDLVKNGSFKNPYFKQKIEQTKQLIYAC